MSTTIDQRVVEMRFDNKNFETNVASTMSTLEKFKRSLNLNGATKGLEDINAATKNVNMSGLGRAVEDVQAKFSALQVVGVTALANITNSAINAGKRIVSALTIDPVKTGFNEYETKINAIQTIMSNTASKGTTMADVTKVIDELNTYADKTIYNFAEMTRNIGTFTAAGVGLKESAAAIQGIANLAAASGSSSQQASTAMYQLSQALAAGTVKLMDWNSVVNAGMGGEKFQEALKATAREHGIAVDEIIEANGSFRESLQEGWISADILNETLKKFTVEGATEYAESMIASGKYTREQADALIEEAKSMEDAATKVKTLTQLWDTLKESAQSGWGKTWELIFGNFEEAKDLFTSLSDTLGGFVNRMSDFRNNLIEGALNLASPWGRITDKLDKAGLGKIKEIAEAASDAADKLTKFQDIVNKVWRGDYGNSDTGRYDLLEKAGYDHRIVQDLVNKGYDYKLTIDDIEASHKKFGITMSETSKATKDVGDSFSNLTDEELRNAGLTEDEISLFRDLQKEADRTGVSISELVEEMSKNDGRTILIDSFKNAGQGLIAIFKALKDAWVEIFPPMTVVQLYNIIKGINEFSQHLRVSDETAKKLKKTFKGVLAIIDILSTVIGGALKTAFKVLTEILSYFDMDILDLTAYIGDAIVGFRDWVDSTLDISKALDVIVPYIKKAAEAIGDWIDGLKETDNIPKYIIQCLVKGLKDGVTAVGKAAVEIGKSALESICNFLGIDSPSTKFIEVGKYIIDGLVQGLQNGASVVWSTIKSIASKIVDIIKGIDFGAIFAAAIGVGLLVTVKKITDVVGMFAAPLEGFGDMMSEVGEMFEGLGKRFKASAWEKKSKAMLNLAISIGILATSVALLSRLDTAELWGAIGALAALGVIIATLSIVAGKVNSIGDFKGPSLSILGISASLLILAIALKQLSGIDADNALLALGMFASLIGGLAIIVLAINKLTKGKGSKNIDKVGGMLLKISAAMLIMTFVIKKVSEIEGSDITKGLAVIASLEVLFAGIIAISKFAGENGSKAGSMILKMSVAFVAMIAVIKLASMLNGEELTKGLIVVANIEILFAAIIAVSKFAGQNGTKAGSMLLLMSGAMLIMTLVIKQISGISIDDIAKGLMVIANIEILFAAIIAVSKFAGQNAVKAGAMLLLMSGAMLVLSGVLFIISKIDLSGLGRALGVITVLELLFGGLIAVSSMVTDDIKGTLITITVAITLLVAAVVALSFLDSKDIATATASISAIIVTFAALVAACSLLKDSKSMLKTLLPIVGVIALLSTIVGILAYLDVEPAIETAASLSILLGSMAASMLILSYSGKTSMASIGALAVMGLVVGELGIILGLLAHFDVNPSIETAGALSILLVSMSGALVLLGVVGAMGPSAFIGIGVLATLIAGIGAVIIAIGALVSEFPKLEEFLDKGIPILTKIGSALGSFFGNIIGGFFGGIAEGVTSAFPKIGSDLSDFMTNAQPFFDGVSNIGPEVTNGVKSIADAIRTLTAANIAQGISSWLPGVSSLADFGSKLPQLGTDIGMFATNLGTFDETKVATVTCAANAIKSLAEAAEGIPNEGGWITAIFGENSIATFGSKLPQLGSDLNLFASNLGEFDEIKKDAIKCAVDAISDMAKAAGSIDGQAEWAKKLFGDNSIAAFGDQLPGFGTNLNMFVTNLGTFDEAKLASVDCAVRAISAMAKVANGIDGQAEWAKKLFGDNSIAAFGSQLPGFGTNLNMFVTNLGTFDETTVTTVDSSVKAVEAFADLADTDLKGAKNNINGFGKEIVDFAKDISSFCEKMPSGEDITEAINNIKKIINMVEDISKSNSSSIDKFAESLKNLGEDGVDSFVEAFTNSNAKTDVMKAGEDLISQIIKGVKSRISDFKSAFSEAINSAVATIRSYYMDFHSAGSYLVRGFADGITANTFMAVATAQAMAQAAANAAKAQLNINSPSKVFMKIGSYIPEGFAMGIDKLSGMVNDSSISMANNAVSGVKDSISRIADVVSGDIDSNPTIRPVLDLSDIKYGAGAISSMLNAGSSVDVLANVGSINSMMNRYGKNELNREIVSAIDKLSNDLSKMEKASYVINGITYDDGSNISDAVKTLVRAAKVERRT